MKDDVRMKCQTSAAKYLLLRYEVPVNGSPWLMDADTPIPPRVIDLGQHQRIGYRVAGGMIGTHEQTSASGGHG